MRICFLVSSLDAGGAERVATTLCNAWAARGDDVSLIATFSAGGEPFYAVSDAVELVSLADVVKTRNKNIGSYAKRFVALRSLLTERNPDVVISFLPNVNVAAVLTTLFTGIPLILCERNDPSGRSPRSFWEFCSRLTFRYGDMFTVQTDAVSEKIHHYYPGLKRVRTIPNPIPEDVAAHEAVMRNNDRKILLSMGRLEDQKQFDKAIAAFSAVAARFPDWDFNIYGEGPLKPQLQACIEQHGMAERIALKGRTTKPWEVMAGADAFLMTSKFEGFPNALLEAMGVGLPCVVTDCPSGPSEMTRQGKDALLVPMQDQKALISALEDIMRDEELRCTLGNQARNSVLRRYSLKAVIEQWDRIFSEVRSPTQKDGFLQGEANEA
ncbi:glycosyltransferase family 4 protein [Herbaspirillum sp. GCM10030257]|uniref:glycosyltransferase family 4 protein n=1 Tax=Herbaspirillum sp. GCM10030257 TaxID=3273393 RepID=UPI00360F16D5